MSPAEFIPVAEDTGAIVPDRGVGAARELRDDRADHSRNRADRRAGGQRVRAPARPSGLRAVGPPDAGPRRVRRRDQLTLEITETALIRADAVTARTLRELESHGIRIVLDDFGTGFSSLSWLKEHPVDAIKIDRSFVSGLADDVRDQAIVSSLIGMSRALGCTVTAEGVETEEQLAALRAARLRARSGLPARPSRCRAAKLEALLVRRQRRSLFGRQQPPLSLLTSVGQLELDISMGERLDRPVVQRRVGAPQAGDQLGVVRELLEHLAQRLPRPAPGDDLLLDEADGVAGAEAALSVVDPRRRDRPGADVLERAWSSTAAFWLRVARRVER